MTRSLPLFFLLFLVASSAESTPGPVHPGIRFRSGLHVEEVEIGNLLTWRVYAPNTADRYLVLRSDDGLRFITIGETSSGNLLGDEITYSFLDLAQGRTAGYYRLACLLDGESTLYTPAVFSRRTSGNRMWISGMSCTITSRPFRFRLESTRPDLIRIVLRDLEDHILKESTARITAGGNDLSLDLSQIHAGYCELELRSATESERVILQKTGEENSGGTEMVLFH